MSIQRITTNTLLGPQRPAAGIVGRVVVDPGTVVDLDALEGGIDLEARPGRSVERDGARGDPATRDRGDGFPAVLDDRSGFVAYERALFEARRIGLESATEPAGRNRSWSTRVDGIVDSGLRHAAATLGVTGVLSQDEVDRRFREIVKAERPDLGSMSGERLDAIRTARARLTGHLHGGPWFIGVVVPVGVAADLRA